MKLSAKHKNILYILLIGVGAFLVWELFVPRSLGEWQESMVTVAKGQGNREIAAHLEERGIIRNRWFFQSYVLALGKYRKLQAGTYALSPSESVYSIVRKLTMGDVAKQRVSIIEGWTLRDVVNNLTENNVYSKEDLAAALIMDFSADFPFLKNKSKAVGLEGYLFPDTYYVTQDTSAEAFVRAVLKNFDEKLTPEMRTEIAAQKKSIFDIVVMASILEKEVRSLEDKKVVAGILWKRLETGMPLQVDATVNYATGKSNAKVSIKDTKVKSGYNTYQNYGLPIGPISNPGMESILAAIYPTKTPYWYYLSADGTGQTIFSKTFQEHLAAMAKYFN